MPHYWGGITPYFRLFEQWKRDIGFGKTYGEDAKFIQLAYVRKMLLDVNTSQLKRDINTTK